MAKCKFCGKEFNATKDAEKFNLEYIYEQIDHYGMESLTEAEQAFYENILCGKCFEAGKF